jgi:cyclopropane-fatty-acyl-phospholipid synthase
MASRADMDFVYSTIDRLFRASLGEMGDFSGARYEGDFSLTLEQAQRRKHDFIFENLRLRPGQRVLDLGCGWGPMLNYFRSRGIQAVGVTLSERQMRAGRQNGLDVHLMDARTVTPETFGLFDGLVSLGAFEHFCTPEDYLAGRQEAIYRDFFRNAAALLPAGGRFYLQTMVFGPRMLPYDQIDIDAPRDSDAFMLARMQKQFPGSWLPYGVEQLVRTAAPSFRVVSQSSGKLDYIETIRQWHARFKEPTLRKLLIKATLAPKYFLDRNFRHAVGHSGSANTECFKRDLMDHFRLVLEKERTENRE